MVSPPNLSSAHSAGQLIASADIDDIALGLNSLWTNTKSLAFSVLSVPGVGAGGDDGALINNNLINPLYAALNTLPGDAFGHGVHIYFPPNPPVPYNIATPIEVKTRFSYIGDQTLLTAGGNVDIFRSHNFGRIFQATGGTTTVINLPATYAPGVNSLAGTKITACAGGANAQNTVRTIASNTTTTITVSSAWTIPVSGDYFNVGGSSGTTSNDGCYNAKIDGFILDAKRLTNTGQFNGISLYGAGNIVHNLECHDIVLWTEWSPTSYTQLYELWFNPTTGAQGTSGTAPAGAHLLGWGVVCNDYDNIDLEFINLNSTAKIYSPHYVAVSNDYASQPITAGWTNLGPGDSRAGRIEVEAVCGFLTGFRGILLGVGITASSTALFGEHLMVSQNFDWGIDFRSGECVATVDAGGMNSGILLFRNNGGNKIIGRVGRCQANATPPASGTGAFGVQFDNSSNMNTVDLDFGGYQGMGAGNFYFNFNGGGIGSQIRAVMWNQNSANSIGTQETAWNGTPPQSATIELLNNDGSVHIPGTGTWPTPAGGGTAYPISYFQRPTGVNTSTGTGTINAGAITTGATVTPVGECQVAASPAAAVTGVILAAATYRGQTFVLFNESVAANSITFAASGTSRVADGTSCVIPGLTGLTFRWNDHTSLWYHI